MSNHPGDQNKIVVVALLAVAILCGLCWRTRLEAVTYGAMSRQFHTSVPVNTRSSTEPASGSSSPSNQTASQQEDVKNRTDTRDVCTFALFRDRMKAHGYFPSSGNWTFESPPFFEPDFCKFQSRRISPIEVSSCLLQGNVKSVVTIGDSNAANYFLALKESVTNCVSIKAEAFKDSGLLPDKGYFKAMNSSNSLWEEHIKVYRRFCAGCASRAHLCSVQTTDGSTYVRLEYLAMSQILDNSVHLDVHSVKNRSPPLEDVWALTSQEVIFRYVMEGNYPDVLLVFLPFNNAKLFKNAKVSIDLEYFRLMANLYLPKETKVFYLPSFAEFESKRKTQVSINRTFESMLATEKIDSMNHILYERLENELLDKGENRFAFMDLLDISRSLEDWNIDGVLMKPEWYEAVMTMFWETFCNSVRYDAF